MADSQPMDMEENGAFRIVFVCTGNTCRSPMAMAIARDSAKRRGWSHVTIESAGLSAAEGAPAAENAVRVAEEHGLDLRGHRSRPLDRSLIDEADLILAMSPSHLATLDAFGAADKASLVTALGQDDRHGKPVADPVGAGIETYRATFGQLREAIEAGFDRIGVLFRP